MSSHRSIAMMSAPSAASSRACDRPCPRAAPVMTATLPSTLPATVTPRSRCVPAADSAVADGLRFQVLLETFDAVLPADPAGLVPAIRCVSPVEEAAVDVDGSDAQPAREGHRPVG